MFFNLVKFLCKNILFLLIKFIKLTIFIVFLYSPNALADEKISVKIKKGDTFYKVFKELNIDNNQSNLFISALNRRLDLRKIPAGQEVNFYFKKDNSVLLAVTVPLKKGMTVLAWQKGNKIISNRLSDALTLNIIKAVTNGEDFKPTTGEYSFLIKKGDNFTKVLTNAGVEILELQNIISAVSNNANLNSLRPNDKITLFYSQKSNDIYLEKVVLNMSGKMFLVKRDDFGVFRYFNEDEDVSKEYISDLDEEKIVKGDTILDKLKLLGWTAKEAREAVDAFATVYDPKRIGIGFSMIFPKDRRVKVFAVTIFDKFAIIVTKINENKYLAKKTTIVEAKRFVSNLKYVALEKEVKDETNKQEEDSNKNFEETFLEESIDNELSVVTSLFEGKIQKGDSLISMLLTAGGKKKSINMALKVLSTKMDPNLIKIGSSIFIALGEQNEPIKGFFIEKSKNKGFLVKHENGTYIVKSLNKKKAKIQLAALVKPNLIPVDNQLQIVEEWNKNSLIEPYKHNVKIFTFKNGDTISHAFVRMKIKEKSMFEFIQNLKNVFDPKKLKVGQRIKVFINKQNEEDIRGIVIQLDKIRSIEVFKIDDGIKINKYKQKTLVTLKKSNGEIISSLYLAAKNSGLPVPVLMEMVRIYSFDVDFQREIQKGDGFEVLYESHMNEDKELVSNGPIRSATLILSGERFSLYRYEYSNNLYDYFDYEGNSAKKALMRTPLDGARITSNFGNRKHPILGYTKMHKGVDFGASRNTPIYAAGDGIIESAKWNGGYGNYIRIRHNSDYKTAYAHLEKFAKFIRKGKRVKQGDIIGYVGSTGRSTGPHLHYEIIFRGKQVNPLKIRMPKGLKLRDKNLEEFILERNKLDKIWNDL